MPEPVMAAAVAAPVAAASTRTPLAVSPPVVMEVSPAEPISRREPVEMGHYAHSVPLEEIPSTAEPAKVFHVQTL
jgi:hypothetical protein